MTKHLMTEYTPTAEELRQELEDAARDLHCAYAHFDAVSDPELVEACIYEIDFQKARYSYLLRRFKEINGSKACRWPVVRSVTADCAAASTMEGGPICPL